MTKKTSMKIRLNILSILLVAVFIFAVGHEIYLSGVDFRQGIRDGYNGRMKEQNKTFPSPATTLGEPFFLKLLLNTDKDLPVDSIYNKKTGQYHKAEFTAVKLYSGTNNPLLITLPMIILTIVVLFTFPILIVYFWKLISNVKREKIFKQANINRLRIMGICFFILAFSIGMPEFILEMEAKKMVEIEGYSIVSGSWFISSLWIYGLISFLVAEIFAIGLRLKEEQELTI